MDRNLFLAILAMDAYNRGYGQHIRDLNLSGSLGGALIVNGHGAAMVDEVLTFVAAGRRFAKALDWAREGDPLVLVLDLDGDGIETTALDTGKAYFDVDGDMFRIFKQAGSYPVMAGNDNHKGVPRGWLQAEIGSCSARGRAA